MNPISSIIRLFLLFVLGVFILLFFYVGLYAPKKQGLDHFQNEISELEQKLLSMKQQRENIKSQLTQKEAQRVDIPDSILQQFPQANDMPALLSTWTQKGKKIGIEFLLFEPLSEKPKGPLIEMPIRITLQGTFEQILEFFEYVSKLERKMLVSNIEMTRPEKKEGLTVISTHAYITTFRRGAP